MWSLNLSTEGWEPSELYLGTLHPLLVLCRGIQSGTQAYSSLLFKPCWAIQLSFRKQEGKGGLRYFTKQFWLTLSHQAVSSGHIFNNFLYWDHHADIIVLPKVTKSLPFTTLVSITVIIQFPPVLFLYFFPSFGFRVFIVTVYAST